VSVHSRPEYRVLFHFSGAAYRLQQQFLCVEFNCAVFNHETGAKMNIPEVHTIIFLDIAVIIIHLVLAYLSKRLGDALKTPPYYKLYYVGIALVITSVFINTISIPQTIAAFPKVVKVITMGLRCVSGLLAVFASLQYWRWIFSEVFKP
jgi:uncharacterized membrane protein